MSGDIFDGHIWGAATGIQWVEAKDAAKYPTMHRTAVQNKGLSSQSVNSAKVEKPSKHQRIKDRNTEVTALKSLRVW